MNWSAKKDLERLREIVGSRAYKYLRRGGLLQCWRRTTPWNYWTETAKHEILWHSGETRAPMYMFELVLSSTKTIEYSLTSGEIGKPEHSFFRLKEEYLPNKL